MFGRSAVGMIHQVFRHLIFAVGGVSFMAFIVANNNKPPSAWGIIAILGIGISTGLAFYGITSLIVDYKESRNWKELKQNIIEKIKKAYRN